MLRVIACLVTLLLTAAVVDAQPSTVEAPAQGTRKSKGFAVGVTVGSVVASAMMLATAVKIEDAALDLATGLAITGLAVGVIGPSFGHMYVGEWGRAGIGVGGRIVGGVLLLGALWGSIVTEGSADTDALVLGGATLVAASTLYDLFDTPAAVDRANRRSFSVAPTAIATPSGSAAGVAVGGTF